MSQQKPWASIALDPELQAIPGMLSEEEKRYLSWVASDQYEGWGAIIDLGCWLGCSSASLAQGLKRAGRTEKVESRDLFLWEPCYMEACYQANLPQDADFLPLFRQLTAPYRDWISVQKSDLRVDSWTGGAIEVLFVDAAKDWNLFNQIFATYGQAIVPEKTRVIFQDFRYRSTYQLPLATDSRPDLWRELEAPDDGWTTTFVATKDVLGPGGMALPYADEDFSFDVAKRIFDRRIAASRGTARQYFQEGLLGIAQRASQDAVAHALQQELDAARN
jgi:hypothetical protein